jgi:hypothetical protein
MKNVLHALIIVFALFAQASAQSGPHRRVLVERYDPSDTSNFVYCVSPGPELRPTAGSALADVAASTTVTGTGAPFRGMGAGDVIYTRPDGASTITARRVTAVTNDNSITVDAALTITGATTRMTWRDVTCGTAAGSGWLDVRGFSGKGVHVDVPTLGSSSLTIRIEGRYAGGAGAELLTPSNITATGSYHWAILEMVDEIRVGQKVGSDSTNLVKITVGGENAN